MAPLVEGHMSRPSVVFDACAPRTWRQLINHDHSALSARKCTCACGSAWVASTRMGLSRYSGIRVWAVPKTSFPTDDVDLEVFVCGEGFPAFCLKRNPKPLESAGDRTEEKLVLAHLRADSGADGCVSGVHIGCIAAGAPHCHMFLNLHKACLLYTSPSPRDKRQSRMPSSA